MLAKITGFPKQISNPNHKLWVKYTDLKISIWDTSLSWEISDKGCSLMVGNSTILNGEHKRRETGKWEPGSRQSILVSLVERKSPHKSL